MVKKTLLSERQRDEIGKYLKERPSAMPNYVRTLRGICKTIDFEMMREDLRLIEELARIKVKIGRKSTGHRDQRARAVIRHPSGIDTKAVFETKPQMIVDETGNLKRAMICQVHKEQMVPVSWMKHVGIAYSTAYACQSCIKEANEKKVPVQIFEGPVDHSMDDEDSPYKIAWFLRTGIGA